MNSILTCILTPIAVTGVMLLLFSPVFLLCWIKIRFFNKIKKDK